MSLPLEPSPLLFPSETPTPSVEAPGMEDVAWPLCSPSSVSPLENNRNPFVPDSLYSGLMPYSRYMEGMIPKPRGIKGKELTMPCPSHFCYRTQNARHLIYLVRENRAPCSQGHPTTWAYWWRHLAFTAAQEIVSLTAECGRLQKGAIQSLDMSSSSISTEVGN